jgi:hypothetical protein
VILALAFFSFPKINIILSQKIKFFPWEEEFKPQSWGRRHNNIVTLFEIENFKYIS